jgi:purine-binding chemotaxis protein CheW
LPNSLVSGSHVLLVGLNTSVCALPLTHVIETMRPLPIEKIMGTPPYLSGVSIVRGVPTPVVDLGLVLGMPGVTGHRFVALRLGDRQVALSVEMVLGVRNLDSRNIGELAPLLQTAAKETIESIGTLDSRMLLVLRASWRLPNSVWQPIARRETLQ